MVYRLIVMMLLKILFSLLHLTELLLQVSDSLVQQAFESSLQVPSGIVNNK